MWTQTAKQMRWGMTREGQTRTHQDHKSGDGSTGHQGRVPTTLKEGGIPSTQLKQDSMASTKTTSISVEYVNWLDGEIGDFRQCEGETLSKSKEKLYRSGMRRNSS